MSDNAYNDKKICSLCKKDFQKDNPILFVEMIANAKHYCEKCGRVAVNPSQLCKPKPIVK